jgi:hypothetical protein
VYRSDTATAIVAPVVSDPLPVELVPVELVPVVPVPAEPAIPEPPRVERLSVERPSIVPPPPAARGWIASGFYLMTLPITMAVDMMLAPVNWFIGSRPRQ